MFSHLLSAVAAKFSKAATASIFLKSKTFGKLFFLEFLPECPYQGLPLLVGGGDSVKHLGVMFIMLMFLMTVMVLVMVLGDVEMSLDMLCSDSRKYSD